MMKRLLILFSFLMISNIVFAQKGKVSSALNYKESGRLDRAVESIDAAVDPANEKSAKSINWPRTWEVRGEIYQAVFHAKEDRFKALSQDPLAETFNSYKKAVGLDTGNKFSKSLKIKLTLLIGDLQNQAIQAYNDTNYLLALNAFEQVLEISDWPIFKADNSYAVDTTIIYNAGLTALSARDFDKAIRYGKEAARYGYNGSKTYNWIASAYEQKRDTLGALDILKQGLEKHPEDDEILTNMIQLYLNLDRREEAMKYLKMAIQKSPQNATYYHAMGRLYEKTGDEENAIRSYEKAIITDSKLFMAFYNLGVIYYNRGVRQIEAANKIPANDNAGYEKELKMADVWFEKSLPFMEKCYEIDPKDVTTVESLRNLYYRLKLMDKYDTIR